MYTGQPALARAVHRPEHVSPPGDMLSPRSLLADTKISDILLNSTSNAVYVVNTSVHHVVEHNSNNNNSSTPRAAQQSNEFYQSYDPSIGLHTAAVLGGILVWLVLYVIYRTKIRKFAIAAFRRKFGSLEGDKKASVIGKSDLSSGLSDNQHKATKPLIHPSIVIDTSPPQTPTKSPSTYGQLTKAEIQECLSPYSLPAGNIKDDMMIFQFPGPLQTLGHNEQHEAFFQQLPISEMDIPTATAQWVQNMPLAARSYQDFAGLMLNMQARKFLPVDKPGSCPLVYVTPPPSLPVLEMPTAWNNSLPVLSSSVSDYLLNVYETVNSDKELKDLINAKRKLSEVLKKNNDMPDENMINEIDSNRLSARNEDKFSKSLQNQRNEKRKGKRSPGLTIDIPQIKDTLTLINNTSVSSSPVPLPVTPTVMIQNSAKTPSRHRLGHDSNTSLSSSSSDLLTGAANVLPASPPCPPFPPPIHITGPLQEHSMYPSYPTGMDPKHVDGYYCGGRYEDARSSNLPSPSRGYSGRCLYNNMCPCHHHQCSMKNSRSEEFSNPSLSSKFQRYGSLKESYMWRQSRVESNPSHPRTSPVPHHRRSMSAHNKPSATSCVHQRSLSADMSSIPICNMNMSNDHGSSFSLGFKSPSPNFLRVPDLNGSPMMDKQFFPEPSPNAKHYRGHSSNSDSMSYKSHNDSCNTQSVFHKSDRNISYYGSPYRPISPLVDTPHNLIRRHSSNYPLSGKSQLVHCPDLNARPCSSSSYFYPIQNQEPPASPRVTPYQQQSQIQQQQQQQHLSPRLEEEFKSSQQQEKKENVNIDSANANSVVATPPLTTASDDDPSVKVKKSSPSIVMETKL